MSVQRANGAAAAEGSQREEDAGARAARLLLSAIAGTPVVDTDGRRLGSVIELVVDLSDGRVAMAVLSLVEFTGFDDKLFAVPWHVLGVDLANRRLVLDPAVTPLEGAPGFDRERWPDMADPVFRAALRAHYG